MKTYERRFEKTDIDLGIYTHVAETVIAELEKDSINVVRPDDRSALDEIRDDSSAILLDARATLPVSIPEWLPVVCQFIRWGDNEAIGDHLLGWYDSNAHHVLWPGGRAYRPAGPGSLVAGITLRRHKCLITKDDTTQHDALKFCTAHELVHAFHEMRFVVPAFLNWPAFWREALHDGKRAVYVGLHLDACTLLMDREYGSESELAAVAEFWPSQAATWFSAIQAIRSLRKARAVPKQEPHVDDKPSGRRRT